ncbi:MAG: putative DNA repair and recombination protein RAD26 [Streblomastix strix]|uniref:Putative DNA repair and recombination protein RAD26 n=1 Tax=Streblomastix strix TaxID=222440 RepID=A0A5J4VU62_9EUKA|nr:MAG: putative DNA repair and recombination protein RAD26 [Streblomastix strix]
MSTLLPSPPRIPGQRGDYVPYIENIDDAVNALEYRKTQKQNLKSRMVELEQQKEAVVERIRVEEQHTEDLQIQDNNQSYNNEEEDIEQSLTPMIDDINHPSISISPDQSISITPSLTPQPFEQQQQQQQNSLHTFQQQPLYYNIDTTTLPNGQKITLQIPYNIWICLLPFQQSGVRWLWGLHQDEVGGLLGDEMGLGKTIQTLAFLEALKCSGIYKPSLLLCPATVMKQWKEECKIWAPHIRPIILHTQFDSEQNREERVQQKQEKMMEKDLERERKKKKKYKEKEKEKKNNLDKDIKQKKNSSKKTKMNKNNEFFVSDDDDEEQEEDIDNNNSIDESDISINHNLIGNEDDEDYKEEYDMDSDINNKGDNTTSEDIELNDEIMLQQKNIQENKDDYNYMKEQEQDIEDELDQMIKICKLQNKILWKQKKKKNQ